MRIDDPELDPVVAAHYDTREEKPYEGYDFFLALANRHPGSRILDVGCGTGQLTTTLALAGHRVMGIDPNPAFLTIARHKRGADRVAWVRGTSSAAPHAAFDLALMTSNVAQEAFVSDDEWTDVLRDLKRALVPGGTLSFETRDPAARAWEAWGSPDGGTERLENDDGTVEDCFTTVTYVDDVAWFEMASVRSDGSRSLDPRRVELVPGSSWSRASFGYRFRSPDLVRSSLEQAGFRVEHLHGGFHHEPLGQGTGDIVVIATAGD